MIGAAVREREGDFVVFPPSWRPDLTDKWTLAEEVARIEGYDRIPSILPTPPSGRGLTPAQQGRRRVANALAAAGYVETPSFAFTTDEQNDLHGSASGLHLPSVKLANPLDGQAPFLRRSLVPGLLRVAHRNVARGLTDLALFETGAVFLPEPGVTYGTEFVPPLAVRPDAATLAALDASIPPQRRHVAVLLTGSITPKQPGLAGEPAGLADALDAVRTIASAAGVTVEVAQGERAALHPGRTGVLSVGCDRGRLRRRAASRGGRGRRPAGSRDRRPSSTSTSCSRSRARRSSPRRCRATRPRRRTSRSSSAPMCRPPRCAPRSSKGRGSCSSRCGSSTTTAAPGVPEGAKSLTFALRFRAADRTLTAAEATEAKLAGVGRRGRALRGDAARVAPGVAPSARPPRVHGIPAGQACTRRDVGTRRPAVPPRAERDAGRCPSGGMGA